MRETYGLFTGLIAALFVWPFLVSWAVQGDDLLFIRAYLIVGGIFIWPLVFAWIFHGLFDDF